MARYIKVNPLVAKYLQLESDRNAVKDGNYLLWQSDMLKFGPLTQLTEILTQIGGIALMPHEAREEQDGTVTRPLPQATDSRFIMPVRENGTQSGDLTGGVSEEEPLPDADSDNATGEDSNESNNGEDGEDSKENSETPTETNNETEEADANDGQTENENMEG